jgi:molybdopterin-guanine dinucleotide biosynthesis protein A
VVATVLGVVLAGGLGRRLGGPEKPLLELAGRPLISYPLAALREALGEAVVVAKHELPGLEVWVEPPEPRHPLTGIVHALRAAGGRAIFVCAADMPLLDAAEVQAICAARGDAPAVVPRAGGRLQPLCALYEQSALAGLEQATPAAALTATVEALVPLVLERPDARPYTNVNTQAELDLLNRT